MSYVANPLHVPTSQTSTGVQAPSKMVIGATVIGNALEFYDFVTYAFFAVYIGKTFFPATEPMISLLLSVAVFGVGFISRPLGGIVIGAYADRVGRKPAMLLTILLITIGTLGLALTPSFAQIGLAAPLIIVVSRLIQGLGLGGEVGPSTSFLLEVAPPGKRAVYASWQLASQGSAVIVAGLMGVFLSSILSADELSRWGWRVPFVIGLLIIPVGIYMRRKLPETIHEGQAEAAKVSLRPYVKLIALSILAIMGTTIPVYMCTYMTTFAIATLKMPATVSLGATVVYGATLTVFSLIAGVLCERFGRKPMMFIPRILIALLIYPAFSLLVGSPTTASLYMVTFGLTVLAAFTGTATIVAIPELFPRSIRASGLSITYAVGVAVFGGSAQAIITWLISSTGSPLSPSIYVAVACLISAVAVWMMDESRDLKI